MGAGVALEFWWIGILFPPKKKKPQFLKMDFKKKKLQIPPKGFSPRENFFEKNLSPNPGY